VEEMQFIIKYKINILRLNIEEMKDKPVGM